jgi:aldehyde dehydrogenase (NAD+)
VKDQLVDKLAKAIEHSFGKTPEASDSFGRIVSSRHLQRLVGLLDGGAGTVAVGGQVDPTDRFVAPTVTVEPSPDSPIMQEEIFGPILPVLGVTGPAEAAAFITAREKPLALYVFAGDDAVIDGVLDATSSGGVCVNHTLMHLLPPDLPFGGVGESGMGAYHGKAGFDVFSHHKSVLRKPVRPDLKLLYPPYGATALKLVKKLAK